MKTILLRLDLNVPIDYQKNKKPKITNTERIDITIPEIKNLSKKNKLIIISHLGKGKEQESLKPIEGYLRKKLSREENQNISFLENSRFLKGETAKPASKEFKQASKYFAGLGDEYIDDAFSVMHRAHASIVGIPKIFREENKKISVGINAKLEIKNINKSLKLLANPKNNTFFILSGAKISTKLPLLKHFLSLGATIFVGGAMANQIYKEVLGKEIGTSFIENEYSLSKNDKKILAKYIKEKKILLPIDFILKDNSKSVELLENIKKNDYLADIGPASLAILKNNLLKSKNIILNGPLGQYDIGFDASSISLLKFLKTLNVNILIGGGDTLYIVKKANLKPSKSLYISMAGGAMLEYLIKKEELPGLKALK